MTDSPAADSPRRDDLPLPDFDHIPLGTLPTRIAPLDADGVRTLLAFERAHGDRLPVTNILERRLEALESGAEPAHAGSDAMPEMQSNAGGSPVSPTTARDSVPPPAKSGPMLPHQPA